MKLNTDAFQKSLQNDLPLKSCYWFSGEESYQLEECKEALRKKAQTLGFCEVQRLEEKTFDLAHFSGELYAASLLSPARIIELSLKQGKIEAQLADILARFCQRPNPSVIIVLTSTKLESGVASSHFFKTLDAAGVIVQSWPMPLANLPKWFAERLTRHGLRTSLEGLKALAELTEGNLLYGAQSVEKLSLLFPQGQTLTPEQIFASVAPQAVFDTFQLNEAFLAGDKIRALKICRMLQASDVEIILVWGALLKDIRLVLKMKAMGGEKNFAQNCQKLGVWEKKRPLYRQALQRSSFTDQLLEEMAIIDQQIKNTKNGNPWLSLERFMLYC